MSLCQASLVGDRVVVRAPFALKETLKAIAGRRWDPKSKAWTYPATPHAAASLLDAIGPEHLERDHGVEELLVKAQAERDAAMIQVASEADLEPIPRTKTSPWLHQLRAYHWIRTHEASLLYMGMGTGKTKCVIDAIVNLEARRVLVVAPLSVLPAWSTQVDRHAAEPIHVAVLDRGTVAQKRDRAQLLLSREHTAMVVVNYESAWRQPFGDWALAQDWDMLVLDESHRIKSPGGKASRWGAKIGPRVPRRVALTGTPMPHSPMDIYGQYRALDAGIFGTSMTVFRSRYAVMGGFEGRQVLAWKNQEELHGLLYRIAFKAGREVLDLPEETTEHRRFDMGPSDRRFYRELEAELVAGIGSGVVTATNALTKLLRLAQISSGFVRDEERVDHRLEDRAKVAALEEVLEDMGVGVSSPGTEDDVEPVVVFCRFHHDLDAVHEVVAKLGGQSLELSGRTNQLAGWQGGAGQVLAVQIQSGGVGIDLTRSRYCVYYSIGYSLGDYEQSRARISRPGQERPTTFVHLVARDTVDEAILDALEGKRDVVDYVLETLGG